jgi:tetratricopeptide (TPR) repeat protein
MKGSFNQTAKKMSINALKVQFIIFILIHVLSTAVFSESIGNYYTQLQQLTTAKNFITALDTSLRAIKEYPEQEGFYIYALWTYRETKNYAAAMELGKKALTLFPDSKSIRENLSYVYAFEAARIFDNKLALDPLPIAQKGLEIHRNGTTLLWYGISLKHNGKLQEACAVFAEGKTAYPDITYFKPNLIYTLIDIAQLEKDQMKSDALILKAYTEDPGNEGALIWYGISNRRNKNFDAAIKIFTRGMKQFPNNKYYRENARWTFTEWTAKLTDTNDVVRARILLGDARKLLPDDPFIISSLAYTYFRRDHKKWEDLCRESVALIPKEKLKAINTYQMPLQADRILIHQGNMEAVTHMGIGAGYGFDLVIVDKNNSYGSSWPKKEDHLIYGAPVYTALDGTVMEVNDKSPDTEPGKELPFEVNFIRIEHANSESSYYMHLQQNSAIVKIGDPVKKGQQIAKVGCSGRYVDFPHLHFQVMRDNICVEFKFTGAEIIPGSSKNLSTQPFTPGKKDVLQSVWK